MLLGFAITRHCNLRCPHCIRDDVTTVAELEPEFIARVVDDGLTLWGSVTASLTGGEPLIHRRFTDIVDVFAERGVSWAFTSNGWHIQRAFSILRRYPPKGVRLSLSGANEAVHDAERGRGSFRRILMGIGVLRHLGVPASLSMVVDERDRTQLREAADLAEALGCARLSFILPQPVTGSMDRGTDLEPDDWWRVRDEVVAIAREAGRRTRISLDFGGPFVGEEATCATFALDRVYVDHYGRLSTCCQLSDYGFNDNDVVADLHKESLLDVWPRYVERLREQQALSARPADGGDVFDAFPCIRCARVTGKLEWIRAYRDNPWAGAALPPGRQSVTPPSTRPRLVRIRAS